MPRVFLDANALFSAAYGSPGIRVLWQWAEERRHELIASDHVVAEARRNLIEPRHLDALKELLPRIAIVVPPPPDIPCPISLPEGDREAFLAAVAVRATHFLTGDIRHFGSYYGKRCAGVLVQSPAEYIRAFTRKKRSPRPRPGSST